MEQHNYILKGRVFLDRCHAIYDGSFLTSQPKFFTFNAYRWFLYAGRIGD